MKYPKCRTDIFSGKTIAIQVADGLKEAHDKGYGKSSGGKINMIGLELGALWEKKF